MISTFTVAVICSTSVAVALSSIAIYLFAEAKWRHHPLARSIAAAPSYRGPAI